MCTVYDGEVFKGRRHGYGTFKCSKSPIVYTGDWHMGKIHGKVRINCASVRVCDLNVDALVTNCRAK